METVDRKVNVTKRKKQYDRETSKELQMKLDMAFGLENMAFCVL